MIFMNKLKAVVKETKHSNPRLYRLLKALYGNKFIHYGKHYLRYKYLPIITGTYSQYGEDNIIDKLLGYKNKGIYVDIGANRPKMMNNTYMFYKRGWSGINIEPQTNLYNQFLKSRKKDINLNVGIGNSEDKTLDFYIFKEDELSTFSEEAKKYYIENGHEFDKTELVPIRSLSRVIEEYSNKIHKIDFMSIDVEGFELDVLDSYDWKIKPLLIVLESNGQNNNEQNVVSEHLKYLEKYGYYLAYFNGLNSFFLLKNT